MTASESAELQRMISTVLLNFTNTSNVTEDAVKALKTSLLASMGIDARKLCDAGLSREEEEACLYHQVLGITTASNAFDVPTHLSIF